MAVHFEESKTKENLMRAFAGESQARNRYTIAAERARRAGMDTIAEMFLYTADQERAHAERFYELLKEESGKTIFIDGGYPVDQQENLADLLKAAEHNEKEEFEEIYPAFAEIAKQEGFFEAASAHVNTFAEDLKSLLHENLHRLLMTPSMVFITAFTILPLIFMICMAFTNYSKIDNHLMLFDWVGLENFKTLFDADSILGSTFWSVLVWTLVWAFFATFTNYIFGMILAIVINRKDTKAKGFWRFCFVLSCAVPMFVSLLIMRTMLQPEGAVNVLLRNLGWIAQDASLPFFTDPTWARVTVIVVNIWVGVPYTLLQLTGVLQNIPADIYEAAKVDGANAVQIFFKITLPYMLYVTTPYLIATFTGNVNNFNIIYLLSGGDPITDLSSTAGSTDLLVTWLYKLTIDKQYYNIGAVIGILTFIILTVGALFTYRRSKSYKEEGGF